MLYFTWVNYTQHYTTQEREETMNSRNVKKHIEKFDKMLDKSKSPVMAFNSQEYRELYSMSKGEYEMIDNAVRFGFMVGYKYGKNEGRN